jgi:hypothetical protein
MRRRVRCQLAGSGLVRRVVLHFALQSAMVLDMKAVSFRLPDISIAQLRALAAKLGATKTQVIVIALERLWRETCGNTSESESCSEENSCPEDM